MYHDESSLRVKIQKFLRFENVHHHTERFSNILYFRLRIFISDISLSLYDARNASSSSESSTESFLSEYEFSQTFRVALMDVLDVESDFCVARRVRMLSCPVFSVKLNSFHFLCSFVIVQHALHSGLMFSFMIVAPPPFDLRGVQFLAHFSFKDGSVMFV